MPLGPCLVAEHDGDGINNPYAWNTNVSIIFMDQPVGVGFSYADYGEIVVSSVFLAAPESEVQVNVEHDRRSCKGHECVHADFLRAFHEI